MPYRKNQVIHCWDTIEGEMHLFHKIFYRIDSGLSKGQMYLPIYKQVLQVEGTYTFPVGESNRSVSFTFTV